MKMKPSAADESLPSTATSKLHIAREAVRVIRLRSGIRTGPSSGGSTTGSGGSVFGDAGHP